jgi:hypothetical protein
LVNHRKKQCTEKVRSTTTEYCNYGMYRVREYIAYKKERAPQPPILGIAGNRSRHKIMASTCHTDACTVAWGKDDGIPSQLPLRWPSGSFAQFLGEGMHVWASIATYMAESNYTARARSASTATTEPMRDTASSRQVQDMQPPFRLNGHATCQTSTRNKRGLPPGGCL